MFMFGKYKRMKEYIKELEENIDELELSLQELRLHLDNRTRWSRQVERVGQVSRMARWRLAGGLTINKGLCSRGC